MKKATMKKTDGVPFDAEERNVTIALRDIFATIAKTGATEDPLALVGKSLVRCIDDIQFAFYCYENDEVGAFAAIRSGVKLVLPSPDVQRKIVADLRRATGAGEVVVIDQKQALTHLPPVQRRKWKPHLCVAARIACAGRSAAVLAVYLPPDFRVTERHRAWMALFADVASMHLTRFRSEADLRDKIDESDAVRQKLTLCVESMRTGVRAHLFEIAKIRCDLQSGEMSLREAQAEVETHVNAIQPLVDVDASMNDGAPCAMPLDVRLCAWMNDGLQDPRIKAIVGIRGSGKTTILHAVRKLVAESGVDESRMVIVDFEDARFRRFKTADDLLNYLAAFPESGKTNYLFVDEIGRVGWSEDLLLRLQTMRGWNVWVTSSTMHAVSPFLEAEGRRGLMFHRTTIDPNASRSPGELERIWCQIFMWDVVGVAGHSDIRAKEMLAEYYSDHLGEARSLREISKAFESERRQISSVSIRSYRQALVDTHLLEVSPVYDVFAGEVVSGLPGRVFYTDLELRKWRFGNATYDEATRVALNRLYLELRRKYGVVYTPRDREADFVTLQPNGTPVMWKLPPDPLLFPGKFRGG